ncbi:MAG: glycosyltransferase family 4 protein [Chlamydiae bacterium]|nr:glycosyltransferase family 4 protein [Chlamydiota bacterium]MBI3276206.1 glycosyltransferase family 4 protein [Chlamydiota bacterium]
MNYRLGILVSHPIQYYVPWFWHLAKRMDIEVFYAHRQDGKGQAQAGFGVEFDWDVPLLEGYPYRWLKNVSRRPTLRSFSGCDTPEIFDIVRREKFDAFLIFGWNRKSSIQTILACWKKGVPVLMRGDSHLGEYRSMLLRVTKYFPYRFFLPRLSAHLYVGQRNREYLTHYGVPKEKLFFVPHFVDNAYFREAALRVEKEAKTADIRKRFKVPENAFVCLFVGKMISKKRASDFIRACLSVMSRPEGRDIFALLVGDGPLRDSLEQLASPCADQIRFAGFQNQSEMPFFYRAANVLVLPSDGGETWGLVVNEAFACGIPAIVSDRVGCAPDLIEEGKTGYTFPLGQIEVLARKILEIKEAWQTDSQFIQKSLLQKITDYSMDAATKALKEVLETICLSRKVYEPL